MLKNISAELANKLVLYDKIVALEIQNEQLKNELTERIHMCDMRSEKIFELTAERDEARRDLCDLYVKGQPSSSNMTDKDYAAELGWDCFRKEET